MSLLLVASAILIAMLFLLVFTAIRALKRNISRKLVIAAVASLVPGAALLVFQAVSQYSYVKSYIPYLACSIPALLFIALSIAHIAAKPVSWTDRIMASFLVSGIIFIAWLGFRLYEKTGSGILYSTHLTGNLYYDISTRNEYQMLIPSVSAHRFGFVTKNTHFTQDLPNSLPREVQYVSLEDSLLIFIVRSENRTDTFAADLRFEYVEPCSEGLSIVHNNNRFGAIDARRNIVIPVEYEGLSCPFNEMMLAMKNGRTGYINRKNEVMLPFIYDRGGNFLRDSATVVLNGKQIWIDNKGNYLSDYE
jgi:hypothetical protein